MGTSEEEKPSKPENSSSPAPDETNIHVYPDWAAMQAFYGPRLTLPPYYSSAIVSGHAPHPYMWGPPQPMMPYGPYAAVYPHGSLYAHPAVPLGSHSSGHGIPSSPTAMAEAPLGVEIPGKSSGNADQGLMKKLKGFDGLAMSIGNGNTNSAEGGTDHGLSQSGETEGSTDASDGNTAVGQSGNKRSREGTPAGEGKTEAQGSPVPAGECAAVTDKVLGITVSPAGVSGKIVETIRSSSMGKLEAKNSPTANMLTGPATAPQPCAIVPSEAWIQNERELKRERRKQSNRESARRSRLRRLAEAEELAVKVETLGAENIALKSEINRLTANSEKLRIENAALMGKLKNAYGGKTEQMLLDKVDNNKAAAVCTENLLSKVNNSSSVIRNPNNEGVAYEKTPNSGAKLHQLLRTSPRADAVAAS